MKYYLYKLYFTNGATYIGLHREKNPNDGYITSSSYYKKHKDLFDRREIILECKDNETLEIMESIAIMADIVANPQNVNYNKGAWLSRDRSHFDRGFAGAANGMYGKKMKDVMTPEAYEKMRQNWKKAQQGRGGRFSKEGKQKWREAQQHRRLINRQIKEAHKVNKRAIPHYWYYNPETKKETYSITQPEGWIKGRLPHEFWPEERKRVYKEHHSFNAYARMTPEKYAEVCRKNKEHSTGTVWVTNGVDNKHLLQGQDIPEGYWLGMTWRRRKPKEDLHSGDMAYTNGIKNTWVHKGDTPPEGYYKGWTKRNNLWQKQ